MVQCLHQSNAYIKRKLGLWRAEKGNLVTFGPTFRHGAMFAPKQGLYQKEARAIQCPKMYSSRRFQKRTFLCGIANYRVSCKVM